MPKLVTPHISYQASYLEFLHEIPRDDGLLEMVDPIWIQQNFDQFILMLVECKYPDKVNKYNQEWVPFSMFWLVEENRYLGRISIRHELNTFLRNVGGHVGYHVRPTERGKGYGKMLLREALPLARDLGLVKLLVTCDESNEASKKIIEYCNGDYESKYYGPQLKEPKLRYWIHL